MQNKFAVLLKVLLYLCMKSKQPSPTPIRLGDSKDKSSLKSKLIKKAAKKKKKLHPFIVDILTKSLL